MLVAVTVADLNGDTYMDIVIANNNYNYVNVLVGYGNGTFGEEMRFTTNYWLLSVTVADFNSDGRMDITVTSEYSNTVNILLNTC
jgi:hypothetical protein